jgi:hypothetical protein
VRRGFWLVVVLVVFGWLAPSPAIAQEWYELYANGERALRTNQPQRAADLLQRAIRRRPQPGLAVPTYGTNFEPRYFPYLRLAEAYLRTEAFEEALKALETSARLGVEPGAERTALEGRVRAAMDARRPPPQPAPLPASTPPPDPAPALPLPTPAPTATPNEAPVSAPVTTNTAPSPTAAPPRPAEPVFSPPTATGAAPSPAVSTVRPAGPARQGPPALEITSAPPGAEVFVDDERVGRTDPETGRLRLTTLRPGRHRVRLSSEGRDDLMREIDLAGESLQFHAVLSLRTTLAPAPLPTAPTEQRWSLPRVPTVGIALGLMVVALFVFLFRSRPRPPKPADGAGTPARLPGTADKGTDEGLPVAFGDYRLIRRIGKGGMASVYEAERRGERFALKRPLAGFLDDRTFIERFLREADLGRALHHPNIVRIFDQGQVGTTPYFAMEIIDGDTLRARLERDGRLDPVVATRVTAQVAEALDYAHHKGVIHRDLKPSNIMFERSGNVKVMDYGIARSQRLEAVTTVGSFLGTPHYAAPETVEAQAEPRSDIYSLGVVFFEMLTGALPFRGNNAFEVLHNHCVTPPPAPSSLNYALSKELDRIVLRLLSKQPSDRPTAEDLLNELADYLKRADEAV